MEQRRKFNSGGRSNDSGRDGGDNRRSNFSGRSGGDNRRSNFSGRSGGGRFGRKSNFNNGPREMHKATCSKCKKECEVPFKPTEGRDVFCKDCFVKRN